MKIGIIGGGIAGLAAAWLLSNHNEVVLFEKQARCGGHADTVEIEQDGILVPIEAGFEFFSDSMFPRFNRLLDLLGVEIERYRASLTLYSADQRKVTLFPPYGRDRVVWSGYSPRALVDLIRFQNVLVRARALIERADPLITLEQYLTELRLPDGFKNDFLYPFLLAEWCVELDEFRTFSAYNVFKYVVMNKPTGVPPTILVNEVAGGMQAYVKALVKAIPCATVKLSADINHIDYADARYTVHDANRGAFDFDHLIIAAGPRDAIGLLTSLNWAEPLRAELRRIETFKTTIAVHSDRRLMPADERTWSVVNTRYEGNHSSNTIWKKWKSTKPIFRSWVTYDRDMPAAPYAIRTYDHPKVTLDYYRAQRNLGPLQGTNHLWLAGLYMHDIDCHESAILSAVKIAQQIDPLSENLQKLMQ